MRVNFQQTLSQERRDSYNMSQLPRSTVWLHTWERLIAFVCTLTGWRAGFPSNDNTTSGDASGAWH